MGNAESRQLVVALSSACQGIDDNIPSGRLEDPQFLAALKGFLRHVELLWDKLPACLTDIIKNKFSPRFASDTDLEAWVQQQIFGEIADDMATHMYDQLTKFKGVLDPFNSAKRNLLLVAFANLRKAQASTYGKEALADYLVQKNQEADPQAVRTKCSTFASAGERLQSTLGKVGGCGALICGLAIPYSTLTVPKRFKETNIETIHKSVRQEIIGRCNKQVEFLLKVYESQACSWIDRQKPVGSKRKREKPHALPQSPPRVIVDTQQHVTLDSRIEADSTEYPLATEDNELHDDDSTSNLLVQCHYDVGFQGCQGSHAGASDSSAVQVTGSWYTPSTATTKPITLPARRRRDESLANNGNQGPTSGQVSNAVLSTGSHSWCRDAPGSIQQQPATSQNASFRETFGTGQQFIDGVINGKKHLTLDVYIPTPPRQLAMEWTVPDTALSITYAIEGNIAGLRDLFNQGLASPRDTSYSRRYSLIRWALYGGMHQYEVVHYLISLGVSVDDESYKHVWDFGFRNKCNSTQLDALKCIMFNGDRDWIDDQKFPLIHLIILGLDSKSLSAELEENPDAVHLKDAQGRTALDWATARAQLDNMKLLIKYGSNVNTMDVSGRTTVLHAVDSHSDAALEIVLGAGANPDPALPNGFCRSSPLTSASFGGLKEMVCLLLMYGANFNTPNPEGRTALHTMIMYNKHEVLRLFVNECEKYNHLRGLQLLPIIARYADKQTISILVSSRPFLRILDLNCDNSFREILRLRGDYCVELELVFECLLAAA
ncbi:ankyrin repeat containing protein [Colletotrichum incanum]|uniref:Ankyrin repeat containing protein n=1 Tax=Colletotrichum incanum TaxID=1573173 RepID=A0A167AY93_COLIC|nr:ankyrin repeat containing protein [Colletotrichum incanum]